MNRRRVIILMLAVIAIPFVLCLAWDYADRAIGPRIERTYEERMRDAIAENIRVSETGQAQVIITDQQLNAAFRSLPSWGGLYPRKLEFSFPWWRQMRVLWSSRFAGSWSGWNTYMLTVDDGEVRFEALGFFSASDGSPGRWGSALEAGINRAIREAGYRAVAVEVEDERLTIDLERAA